jgi:hypothetical protein
MAEIKTWKDLSKENWGSEGKNIMFEFRDKIKTGALQRIADAAESMAVNFVALQNDLDYYKKRYLEERDSNNALCKSNAALRGHITRYKKRVADLKFLLDPNCKD